MKIWLSIYYNRGTSVSLVYLFIFSTIHVHCTNEVTKLSVALQSATIDTTPTRIHINIDALETPTKRLSHYNLIREKREQSNRPPTACNSALWTLHRFITENRVTFMIHSAKTTLLHHWKSLRHFVENKVVRSYSRTFVRPGQEVNGPQRAGHKILGLCTGLVCLIQFPSLIDTNATDSEFTAHQRHCEWHSSATSSASRRSQDDSTRLSPVETRHRSHQRHTSADWRQPDPCQYDK